MTQRLLGSCLDCKRSSTGPNWCQSCNSERFKRDFDKWSSGNEFIDKFIQDAQLKARNKQEVLEWIPYNRFENIEYLAEGGFSTIYTAYWLDESIIKWDRERQQWNREDHSNMTPPYKVVLKSLNNSSNINDDFLDEWKNYLNFIRSATDNLSEAIRIFGISQDPETSNYIIVMRYVEYGNLRSNLMIKKYNPNDKYRNLYDIAKSLLALHDSNLVHGDFHSGNILFEYQFSTFICDFGLSRPADKSNKSKEIYGVIPYIAPEVLRGGSYTKAADIYSFGIMMWEMTSGIPAFNGSSHDLNLTLNICRGLRPKIIEGTDFEYSELMEKCWDSDPSKRPTAKELFEYFNKWLHKFPYNYDSGTRVSVPENEAVVQNHPLSCYTSRKFDYSAKLNEILSSNILSSNIVVEDVENDKIMPDEEDDCMECKI